MKSRRRRSTWYVTVSAALALVPACVAGRMAWPHQAEAAPSQMQFRVHPIVDQQQGGLVLATITVPQSWKVASRVEWNYQDVSHPVRAMARAEAPDGSAWVEYFPIEIFYWLALPLDRRLRQLPELERRDLQSERRRGRRSHLAAHGARRALIVGPPRRYFSAGITCLVRISRLRISRSVGRSPPGFSSAATPVTPSSSRSRPKRSISAGPVPKATFRSRISS